MGLFSGKKIEFEFPKIDPKMVDLIRTAMVDADSVLPGKTGSDKKTWVKLRVRDAVSHVDLKKVPAFLEEPIKDAVVGVIIDVIWAVAFQKKQDA
jgi:hypothetical protein